MSRSQSPAVLDGMRAPRSVRLEDIHKHDAERAELPSAPADDTVTVYVSLYRKYRVQVTAPPPAGINAMGIKVPGGQPYVAVFDEGVFRNNHRDPEMRALIDKVLQSNPKFGPFGSGAHFWLARDQNARMEKARVDSALNTLRAMPPEAVAQFVAELKVGSAEDHALPPREPAAEARSVRPIPPSQT